MRNHCEIFLLLSTIGLQISAPAAFAGQTPIQITTTPAGDPSVSPQGDFLVVDIPGTAGIGIVPSSGGSVTPITAEGVEPDWHPSASTIVYRQDSSLYIVDAFAGTPPTLFASVGFDDGPAWSPLGNEIAIQGFADFILLFAYPAGSNQILPCKDPDGSDCEGESPTWSPDGTELAFEDGLDLLRVARNGGLAELIIGGGDDVAFPAWSPDGRWIAYSRVERVELEEYVHIWVVDARGPAFGSQQQTFGAASDRRPAWSPDGEQLYFESDRSGALAIWQIDFARPVGARTLSWGALKASTARPD